MHIKINLRIFIFIIIFCLTRQIGIYGILMLFAFFHELGHLFTGIVLGFRPESLSVNPLGLSINFRVCAQDYNKKLLKGNVLALKKLLIAFGGPAVNFILVIVFSLIDCDLFGISKDIYIYSNFLICIFNLIPIYPLDGGRLLKNLLHIFGGLDNTYSYINLISNISIIILTFFSSICILYVKNVAILLIIGYLWYLVINENKLYNQRLRIYEVLKKELS